MLGVCRLLLRDDAEAEDAAQQTFLSAYRSLLSGTTPHEPSVWLATIARHECMARIRARMREPLTASAPRAELPDPLATAIARADFAAVVRALAALPRKQRAAFMLREFSGLSYGELAAALAVTEPAVESLLFRARRRLRERLRPALTSAGALQLLSLRDALERAVPGFGGTGTAVAAAPLAAKVAVTAAGVGLVVAGAGSVATDRPHPARHVTAPAVQRSPPGRAADAEQPRPAAAPTVVSQVVAAPHPVRARVLTARPSTARAVERKPDRAEGAPEPAEVETEQVETNPVEVDTEAVEVDTEPVQAPKPEHSDGEGTGFGPDD